MWGIDTFDLGFGGFLKIMTMVIAASAIVYVVIYLTIGWDVIQEEMKYVEPAVVRQKVVAHPMENGVTCYIYHDSWGQALDNMVCLKEGE